MSSKLQTITQRVSTSRLEHVLQNRTRDIGAMFADHEVQEMIVEILLDRYQKRAAEAVKNPAFIEELISSGQKIEAIKQIRIALGIGLLPAKALFDYWTIQVSRWSYWFGSFRCLTKTWPGEQTGKEVYTFLLGQESTDQKRCYNCGSTKCSEMEER